MIATVIRNTMLAIPVASAVAMNDANAAGGVGNSRAEIG